jgi:small ligand-binding sensory domain FIST
MKWCSAISEETDLVAAVRAASAELKAALRPEDPSLILVFVSEHHRAGYRDVPSLVGCEFGTSLVIGCSARSVIGGGREIEERPAVSLTAGVLPGVSLHPFHLDLDRLPEDDAPADLWRAHIGVPHALAPQFLLLCDPFSFEGERLVRGLDRAYPASQKVGGVASGGQAPGDNALFVGTQVHRCGSVGVALSGNIQLDTIIAQGCRPIGTPMFVTRCRDNVLLELDGRPPLEVLQELYQSLCPEDRKRCRGSLFLGLEMKAAQDAYAQGDFLIRNLLGSDQESGALRVGALLRDSQVVQFHLRDARTSADDLERRLADYDERVLPGAARGALLFSCLGRGGQLYGRPNHDSDALRRHLGDIALGGFFCNGEIGPVQGQTFLHGYTSAFGIFRSEGGGCR